MFKKNYLKLCSMNKMPYEEEASLSNRDNIQQENQTMKLDWNSGFGRSNL